MIPGWRGAEPKMQSPRLILAENTAALVHLARRRTVRYGIAVAAVAVSGCIGYRIGPSIDRDFYLTILFASMLLASVAGGLGPGLLATVIATVIGDRVPDGRLTTPDIRLLAIEGILVSIVGGALRSARVKAREQLAATLRLEQQIMEVGEDERRRIGHDLHDGLGQHLTGISLLTGTISQQIEAGHKPDHRSMESVTQLVSEAIGITRDLAKTLSPITLEQEGFAAAVDELADSTSALFGIDCDWEYDGPELPLDRARSQNLYRIVQEAVNNSVRHGNATEVKIVAERKPAELLVQITDNGSGLSAKTMSNPGLGLRIMQYRCRMLGGTLAVARLNAEGGTVVTCHCPLDGDANGQPESTQAI